MKIKVFAPATVANLCSGFDILGLCLDSLGDEITVEKIKEKKVIIESTTKVPLDPMKNTAGAGLVALIKDKKLNHGFKVSIKKNIPIGSGLGGSASCAVGSIVGANEFLDTQMSSQEILKYALIGEGASGSQHLDNITPCLLGGITMALPDSQTNIDYPQSLKVLVIHQNVEIKTSESRGILDSSIPIKDHLKQSQSLMALVKGLQYKGLISENNKLITKGLEDHIVEPIRKKNIPNFDLIKKKLQDCTLGGGISGSGPAMFFMYLPEMEDKLKEKVKEMRDLNLNIFFEKINKKGARVLK